MKVVNIRFVFSDEEWARARRFWSEKAIRQYLWDDAYSLFLESLEKHEHPNVSDEEASDEP